jgi:hypothetical protein
LKAVCKGNAIVNGGPVEEKDLGQIRIDLCGLLEEKCPGVGLVRIGLFVEVTVTGVPLSFGSGLKEMG